MVSPTLLLTVAGSVPVMTDPVHNRSCGASPFPSNYSGNTTIHVAPSTGDTSTVQGATMVSVPPISSASSTTSPPQATSSLGTSPPEAVWVVVSTSEDYQLATSKSNSQTSQPTSIGSTSPPASPSGHTSPTSTITHPPTTQTSQPSSPDVMFTQIPPTGTTGSSSSASQPTRSPIEPRRIHWHGGIITLTGTRLRPGQKPTTPPIKPPTATVPPPVSKQSSISTSPTSQASKTSSEALPTTSFIPPLNYVPPSSFVPPLNYIPQPSFVPPLNYIPPSPSATAIQEMHHHLIAVIEALGPDVKDKTRLAVGLSIGFGAGIPAAGLVQWLSTALHKLSTTAENGDFYKAAMDDLAQFRMDKVPHFNLDPKLAGGRSLASEVAQSVDEWYDELYRNGNTEEQAAEIINHFNAGMQAAEAAMAGQATEVESVVRGAAGRTFSNPKVRNSRGVQPAARVASTPGKSAEEIANALLKAGVPTDAVLTVSHAIRQSLQASTGKAGFNTALDIIASSVTSASIVAAQAARAAVGGATGQDLAESLGLAGVPAAIADATAEAMVEAIQAARASGSEPTVAAINVISKAASPAGLAVAEILGGATGPSLALALSAAGVPMAALGTTASSVSAVRSGGDSESAALNAAIDIIDSASVPRYERMSSPAPAVSPAQAALDVVGASFNFWHTVPWLVWDTLNKLKDTTFDLSEEESLDSLLEIGPPPDFTTSFSFPAFPYRRGGNRVTGLPSL